MADRQLIIAVEGTAAMGPFWQTLLSDYLEKIIRSFCGNELTGQKTLPLNVELSLVMFGAHGSHCGCLVQRSGWTKNIDIFLQWLSAVSFAGGGFSDAAIAEGLSEALMMFCVTANGSQTKQNVENQRHCILVSANNPYPLATPVYCPQIQKLEKTENTDAQTESNLFDAEAVARCFSQCSISLSVICPKQLPKLRAIYNAGKGNPRAADPSLDNVKNPQHLVLISENFMEARAALSRSGNTSLPPNQSSVKLDIASIPQVSGPPPNSIASVNGTVMNRQPVSAGNIVTTTVKVEPSTVTSMVSGSSFPHISSGSWAPSQGVPGLQASSPPTTSQDMIPSVENVQEVKPIVTTMSQPLRPVGSAAANVNILNNLRQVMNSAALTGGTSIGLQSIPSMGGTPMALQMSNVISSGMASSVPAAQTVFSSGQSGIASTTGSGTLAGTTQVTQNPALGSFTSATSNLSGNSNLGISQSLGNNIQGSVSMSQSVPGMSQGNISGTQMVQSGIGMNQNMMNGLGSSNVSSGTGTMIPTPGMQSLTNNNSAANMSLPQQTSSGMQSAQSKYVRVWEGNLSGQIQQQLVFITRLEGYRNALASETLAANWPSTMQIVRLISQNYMNNKQYVGKADFLVFRAMNQHRFLARLQHENLCAVIQLPSQTLLLSVSDKACRLIGMLFPGDMVVFKPQIPNQQQQQMQQHQQQQLQQQQHQQLQQQQPHQQMQVQQLPQLPQQLQQQQQQQLQQQPSQQQQMVGTGMPQAYAQAPGRSQLVSQGQISSQGLSSGMPGGAFLS